MGSVFANNRSIVHQGDGKTDTSAPPDVCKTPTPGGPVPVPYVNIAQTRDLASGTKTVKVEGSSAGKADSNLSTSSGDEAGTAGGGLMSSKTKGKLTWATKSSNVKFEGQGVVRFMDVTQHNGNSYNTAFIAEGGTGLAYGDDFDVPCPICEKDPSEHRILEPKDTSIAKVCAKLLKALRDKRHPQSRMIAVALCKCNEVIVAASGSKKPDAFAAIATECGATLVIKESPSSASELASKIKWPAQTRSGTPIDPVEALGKLSAQWESTKNQAKPRNPDGFTTPGSCAAQKVLSSGHVIIQLTEMWYQVPPEIDVREFLYDIKATFDGKTSVESYTSVKEKAEKSGNPIGVASCSTCQVLLPLILCDKERSC